ncbi:hypothetical protein [Nocardia grenadensis]|uniref:hypothetical protein n=1 Tax=Nocardia grenadensis TaxID=931537 RepID=UPI003D750283
MSQNWNRQDLSQDLSNEVSRAYAAVLGRMAGIQIRIDRLKATGEITNPEYRSSKLRIDGLRMACETLYRLDYPDVPSGDLEGRLNADVKRWKKATEADEADEAQS